MAAELLKMAAMGASAVMGIAGGLLLAFLGTVALTETGHPPMAAVVALIGIACIWNGLAIGHLVLKVLGDD